jgi:uncharacterized protein
MYIVNPFARISPFKPVQYRWLALSSGRAALPPGQTWALVTGASQGLGRALAEECARLGLNLLLAALPGEGLALVAQQLAERYHVRATALEVNLAAATGPETLVHWVREQGVPLGVLINNAGCGYNSRFEESTLRQNEACILLNALGTVKITRLLLPQLLASPRAFILNVASLAAFFPMPFMPVYAPSKAFVANFSLALRAEMAGRGVSVSVLCPNGIRTNADCRAQIAAAGWAGRLTCQDAEEVATVALRGMLRGKALIVPGSVNQMIVSVSKIVPRAVINGVVGMFWGRTAHRPRPVVAAGMPEAALLGGTK